MTRYRKADRREHILTELKLYPHVRTSELASRFGVSTETVRRDVDAPSREACPSPPHWDKTRRFRSSCALAIFSPARRPSTAPRR